MSQKKNSVVEVLREVDKQMWAAGVRGASVNISEMTTAVTMRVRRAFGLEGSIDVRFKPRLDDQKKLVGWEPIVTVSFAGSNRPALEACAFAHLVTELTGFAASLQVELNEYEIVAGSEGDRP